MKRLNWAGILSFVAGGFLNSAFALGGPRWTAIGGAVACVGGLILHALPAQKIAEDAPVVNNAGKQIGTNVSTTSTEPIKAPQGS